MTGNTRWLRIDNGVEIDCVYQVFGEMFKPSYNSEDTPPLQMVISLAHQNGSSPILVLEYLQVTLQVQVERLSNTKVKTLYYIPYYRLLNG